MLFAKLQLYAYCNKFATSNVSLQKTLTVCRIFCNIFHAVYNIDGGVFFQKREFENFPEIAVSHRIVCTSSYSIECCAVFHLEFWNYSSDVNWLTFSESAGKLVFAPRKDILDDLSN